MCQLVDPVQDFGAVYLIHGPPAQQRVNAAADAARAVAALAKAVVNAQAACVVHVREPIDLNMDAVGNG
ncbi:MAG: hypothetical protein ACK5V0_03365 [Alphaproteobacteria bacterium]|jgi:hypothetical protein